jgi:hypothetical protein
MLVFICKNVEKKTFNTFVQFKYLLINFDFGNYAVKRTGITNSENLSRYNLKLQTTEPTQPDSDNSEFFFAEGGFYSTLS